MLFLPSAEKPAQQAILRDSAAQATEADNAGISILAVTGNSPDVNGKLRLNAGAPFKLLSGQDGATMAKYGVTAAPRALLVDANARVIAFPLPHAIVGTAITEATSPIRTTEPMVIAAQAPVLAIPDVLSPKECRKMIDLWQQENFETGVATEKAASVDRKSTIATRAAATIRSPIQKPSAWSMTAWRGAWCLRSGKPLTTKSPVLNLCTSAHMTPARVIFAPIATIPSQPPRIANSR